VQLMLQSEKMYLRKFNELEKHRLSLGRECKIVL